MIAIFENRGKQYKAKIGDFLKLPKLSELKKNDSVTFDKVIFMKDDKGQTIIGSPLISGIQIICQVIEQIRDKKIIVFKKHYFSKRISLGELRVPPEGLLGSLGGAAPQTPLFLAEGAKPPQTCNGKLLPSMLSVVSEALRSLKI